jgi:hypothetical protein
VVQTYVVSTEVYDEELDMFKIRGSLERTVHICLGQHRIILELRLAQRRSVAGNDDELGLSRSQRLECRLVSEGDLS